MGARHPGGRPSTAKHRSSRSSHRQRPRAEQKEHTRQALLDAALDLLDRHSFDSISLRQVTRAAGVSPNAFYRHFDDMEELGMVLAEDALGSLRQMIRQVRDGQEPGDSVAQSLALVVDYAADHERDFRFLARERYGGMRRLSRTIRHELQLFSDELAVDLAAQPGLEGWPVADRRMLAGAVVETIIRMVMDLVESRPDERPGIVEQAERQLHLLLLGVSIWDPDRARRPAP